MWIATFWILCSIILDLRGVKGGAGDCGKDLFRCGQELASGKWCISSAWVCDGEKDCPDGSDEEQQCAPPTCGPNKFQCDDHTLCIPQGWICDGEKDCIDGSDEATTTCSSYKVNSVYGPSKGVEEEFECPPNTALCVDIVGAAPQRTCIKYSQFCDGNYDCPGSSPDEGPHCRQMTCLESNTCPGRSAKCAETKDGPVCYCNEGYFYNYTAKECQDINECELDGFCDQYCDNSPPGGYTCFCEEQTYEKVNNTCRAINDPVSQPTWLLVTNTVEVLRYTAGDAGASDVRNMSAPIPKTTLDIDVDNKRFCYKASRNETSVIECVDVETMANPKELQIEYPVSAIAQLAYDWLSKNWYFTDEEHERIFVCNQTGGNCITLLNTDLRGPRAIAVDPTQGLMFFTTLSGPKLERSSLDGSRRQVLVRDKQIVRPHFITLDFVNQQVYWCDSYLERIERVDYDGGNRKLVMRRGAADNVFGLALHDNFLYVTSQRNGSLARLQRWNDARDERKKLVEGLESPEVVKVFHRQRQPVNGVTNPCESKPCDHLCVPVKTSDSEPLTHKCMCKAGYKPNSDNSAKCDLLSGTSEPFLLYSNARLGEVKAISTDPANPYQIIPPISGLVRPVAVDYHKATGFIYYSDAQRSRIGRQNKDGTGRNDSFIATGINNCEGIAIDWIGENIYWTDEGLKTINVARLDDVSVRRVLVRDKMSHPRAIVLNPSDRKYGGFMYWTDWVQKPSPVDAKIERAYMDGSHREVLVNDTLLWPNGLSLDLFNHRLYWCDAYTDRIESYDLETGLRTQIALAKSVKHPYGLVHHYNAQSELELYWTEFTDGHIKRITVRLSEDGKSWTRLTGPTIIHNDSVPLFEIRMYDMSRASQTGGNGCDAPHACSHLCLAVYQGHVCACPDGMALDMDNTTCLMDNSTVSPTACGEKEFRCNNSQCINERWKCDGDYDCSDFSDEDEYGNSNCSTRKCPDEALMYKCSNNRCIYKRWMCDGEDDCRNGEDEEPAKCDTNDCSVGMTRCPTTHRCIPNSWLCDHDNDCGDGYDEQNCTYSMCRKDQFNCTNQRCISQEYVCDGDNDCRDNSDEIACDSTATPTCRTSTHFECEVGDKTVCLELLLRCDGEPNCNNGTDELDCDTGVTTNCSHPNQFRCANGLCVPTHLQCDGDDDCGDFSDESHCDEEITCGPDDFRCPGQNRCIPQRWLCDGDADCDDASDENQPQCQRAVECEHPNRHCANDTSVCVKAHRLCDDVPDCDDGSDEGRLCGQDLCGFSQCSHNCFMAPDGFVCSCPASMKIGPNNRTCVDAYPCKSWGVCSQQCIEHKNNSGHSCKCLPGYALKSDGFTCMPDDSFPHYIFFSNRHEIRRLDIYQHNYVSLVSGLRNTIALDFAFNHSNPNGDESTVFWTDVVDDKIYRGTLISNSITNIRAVVNVGLATAEGLAVDWITNHLYWVESNLDQIEVSNFDGTQRTTLIAGNMESPRAIVVDPRKGMLFWSDWDASKPRIERCSMSGAGRRVIYEVAAEPGAGWPNGLTVDYEADRIYWIDAKSDSIHTTDYNGEDPHTILKGHEFLSHPFAISVFGNHVYWTDWRTNALVQANKWNGTDLQVIQRTITQPFDLHVFHPMRQPVVSNPCAVNNGNCSSTAICLLGYNRTAECRCPHLMKLREDDKKTCEFDGTFLLFAKKQEIRGVDLESYFNVIPALTVPYVYNPLAIDYHIEGDDRRLYWIDDDHMHGVFGIHSAFVNGTNFNTIIDAVLPNPSGFAVDWLSKNMYFSWYDDKEAKIEVAQLSGAYRTVVLDSDRLNQPGGAVLKKPGSIALHPQLGKLYWTDMYDTGSINVANLDGSEPQRLFSGDEDVNSVAAPTCLSIDFARSRLWWVNFRASASVAAIMSAELDGSDSRPLAMDGVTEADLGKIVSIAVFEDTVYFATFGQKSAIHSVSAATNSSSPDYKLLRDNTPGISAMKMFVANRGKAGITNACEGDNPCSQLCLPTGEGSKVCRCTVGFRLADDGSTCEGIKSFLMFSNKTEIQGLTVPDDSEEGQDVAVAPISKILAATAIDFHAKSDYIYWVDSKARKISRIKRDLTNREVLIPDGIVGVQGLAVDWLADNMYWTDQVLNVIEVARTNGSNRFVVLHENIDKPGSIAVHPQEGLLFWAESGMPPRIEQARLDGSERKVLINGSMAKPHALAIDYDDGVMGVLYWCDQALNKIEKFDLQTQQRTVIIDDPEQITDCQGLTVYDGKVYWIDSTNGHGSIIVADMDGSNIKVVAPELGTLARDIKMFNEDRQPSEGNLCSDQNFGCAELCFYLGNEDDGAVCQCAHGRLANDSKTCTSYNEFLAFSTVTSLMTVHMFDELAPNTPEKTIEDDDHMKNVIGLTYDYENRRYFFSDIQRGDIQVVNFNGSNINTIVENVGSAEGLAYDPIFRELYWTSYTNSSISRIRISPAGVAAGSRPTGRVEKVIQLGHEDHPRALVVDSCHSKMYWTNWRDKQASIQKAYLSGWGVEDIITTDIKTPNGLAIDYRAEMLYWSDARLDKIERCDLNGENRKVIVESVPQHAFSLTLYGDYLYWTDWVLRSVIRVNKYTGRDVKYMHKNIPRQPMGIVAVGPDAQRCDVSPCDLNNGGCQERCQATVGGDRECSCLADKILQPDGVSCALNVTTCAQHEFNCGNGACIDIVLTCDTFNHCVDSTDEEPNYCNSRVCPEGYIHCSNKKCIPESKHCNGVNDCGDNSDERKCGCRENEFQCGDGSCILDRYRCDYDKDCPDASDEMNCPNANCSYFGQQPGAHRLIPCNTTTACIMPTWRCDGHNDCWDNSDEQHCTTTNQPTECEEFWFKCNTTKDCIPQNWKCDGDFDCPDRSDEQDCTYSCAEGQFKCVAGPGVMCIPNEWKCDGKKDCLDSSDEDGCKKKFTCTDHEFHCNLTGNCIPKSWLCDGEKDCSDGQDELPGAGCDPMPCDPDEFQCNNYRCIRKSFMCDGDDDCGDKSDEPSTCVYETCDKETQFQCTTIHQCIDIDKKCDNRIDCFDHTDESPERCDKHPCGSAEKFQCDNGICISATKLCDRRNDCGDSSDEVLCEINECATAGYPPCQHECTNKKIGYECSCKKGYKLMEDKRSCKDIDECSTLFPCTHYCFNGDGDFRCGCADGFVLGPDKRTCKANSSYVAPVLLVSNRYYIRKITLSGTSGSVDLLAQDLNNAVALDFHWEDRQIYWSDVTSTGSSICRRDVDGGPKTIIHNSTLRNPDGIAVDWLGRNLYWCDKTTDTIEVSKLSGLYRKVLVRTGLQEPRALAVHPYKGYLFYTDWGDDAHIGRLGMDGSQPQHVVSEKLGWPNALTIDYIADHIYWADARLDYIAMADLDGKNTQYILKDNLPHVFALSVFENYIYWTDWEYKSVERAEKYTGLNRTNVTIMIHRPMDIQVFHPLRQMPKLKKNQQNPCNLSKEEGGCGEGALCLIKPGGSDKTCACPERHYLSPDKTSCISNCTSSEFLCASTFKCIPFWWQCDGQNDCGDGSDEPPTCGKYYCKQPGLYQCANATSSYDCISPTQICDGTPQCPNGGSDELNCEAHTCMDSQFKCLDHHKCIPLAHRCNGQFECDDHSDEKDCPVHTCTQNQFQCANKRCIPYVWRCDHDNDCGDDSDEPQHCVNTTCLPGYIKCKISGRCVPATWQCDGDNDCGPGDNSDEPEDICMAGTCEATYFKCNNNRCIPGRWQCDYDDDCRDGSDEIGCMPRNCSETEKKCDDMRCIKSELWCDGIKHCADGSDELKCEPPRCKNDEFRCPGASGHCVPSQWLCDGEDDCVGGADEANCTSENTSSCTWQEFKCGNGMCIPASWQCDGDRDCFDGLDEDQETCSNFSCFMGYMPCDNKCIPRANKCDGIQHCSDNSDEENCEKRNCTQDQFRCTQTGQCIEKKHVCDNYIDCIDRSDELECSINCTKIPDGCDTNKYCDALTGRCVCMDGYELRQNGQCYPIVQCDILGKCSQICIEHGKVGSPPLCKCDSHFSHVYHDNSSCLAEGKEPYLLIGTENEIHAVSTEGMQYQMPFSPVKQQQSSSEEAYNLRIDSMAVFVEDWSVYLTDHHTPAIWKFPLPEEWRSTWHYGGPAARMLSKRDAMNAQRGQMSKVLDSDSIQEPRGIAVDWVTGNIYWSDSGTGTIKVAPTEDMTNAKTLVNTNLDHPYALVLDPMARRMYWSLWGPNAKIETARLDGSEREVLINSDIEWPAGLAIDHPNRRIYWTDTKKRTVETVTMDGKNRENVWTFGPDEDPPFKIDVFEDSLYVTTFKNHSIFKLHKFGKPAKKTQIVQGLNHIGDVIIIQQYKQKEYLNDSMVNPCESAPCAGAAMCLNLPSTTMSGARLPYTCLCPDGFVSAGNQCEESGEIEELPCEDRSFCLNNGTCHITEHGEQKCRCPDRFYGSRCQKDSCYEYCLNGGQCEPKGPGKATCRQCPPEYTGERCDVYVCSGVCENNGLCIVDRVSRKPICVCPYGFWGDHCEKSSDDVCHNWGCRNNATCTVDSGRPKCVCPPQYSGQKCEVCTGDGSPYECDQPEADSYCTVGNDELPHCVCSEGYNVVTDCSSGRCQDSCQLKCDNHCPDHASCHYNDRHQPYCRCDNTRYTGDKCNVDKCEGRCKNDGVCEYRQQGGKDTFVCHCAEGWAGDTCELLTVTCAQPQQCENDATCVPYPDGSTKECQCRLGYSGHYCSNRQGCDIVDCVNGGSCQSEGKNFVCKCVAGYMGERCEVAIPAECDHYCENGGRCSQCDVANHMCTRCSCDPAYMGDRCEIKNPQQFYTSTATTTAIILPILLLLIILIVVVAVFMYRRRAAGNQFKHQRMGVDGSNMEISNPIYMKDYDDEEADGFSFDGDKAKATNKDNITIDPEPTNFSNPMYDTLYNENATDLQPDSEKKQLLKTKNSKLTFYGEEEPPDTSFA